jgi:hypothetical protein
MSTQRNKPYQNEKTMNTILRQVPRHDAPHWVCLAL